MTYSFFIDIDMDSDWGVATGAGVVGGIDSVIERDRRGQPVLRGTVLTGILRENAQVAAIALDEGDPSGPWSSLCARIFGSAEAARLITFTDAVATDPVETSELVSVSIDSQTQTAKDDHLRFFERAGAARLCAQVVCCTLTTGGARVAWTDAQLADVELLLAVACDIVEAVGSDKSVGDGSCRMRLRTAGHPQGWPWNALESASRTPTIPTIHAIPAAKITDSPNIDETGFFTAPLDIDLLSPVISYETPFSNEVRSLDFLRGTTLLAWAHRQMRAARPDDDIVSNAVTSGDLRISDAIAVIDEVPGLPVPFSLSRSKDSSGLDHFSTWNHLRGESGLESQVPIRRGFLYGMGEAWRIASTPMTARQSSAHDPMTGTAQSGQLYLVHALSPGLRLRAELLVSNRLRERLPDLDELLSVDALLGARRLSGTFGRAHCSLGPLSPLETPSASWDEDGTTTLWLASDLVLRSSSLGPTRGIQDFLDALTAVGAQVVVHTEEGAQAMALRYRRIDSRASDATIRSTRIAIQAGSVLRITPAEEADPSAVLTALRRMARDGLGELRAQGYGRILVAHPLLSLSSIALSTCDREAFLNRKES